MYLKINKACIQPVVHIALYFPIKFLIVLPLPFIIITISYFLTLTYVFRVGLSQTLHPAGQLLWLLLRNVRAHGSMTRLSRISSWIMYDLTHVLENDLTCVFGRRKLILWSTHENIRFVWPYSFCFDDYRRDHGYWKCVYLTFGVDIHTIYKNTSLYNCVRPDMRICRKFTIWWYNKLKLAVGDKFYIYTVLIDFLCNSTLSLCICELFTHR